MAEADLSPPTFTSRSASDPDYVISTEDSSENENENTYTEASRPFQTPSDFIIRPRNRRQCKVWSPQEFDDAKGKAKADLNWIKLPSRRTDQITENNLQEMAAWLFFRKSKEATGIDHGLREELLLLPRIGFENYPSRKAFATHFIW